MKTILPNKYSVSYLNYTTDFLKEPNCWHMVFCKGFNRCFYQSCALLFVYSSYIWIFFDQNPLVKEDEWITRKPLRTLVKKLSRLSNIPPMYLQNVLQNFSRFLLDLSIVNLEDILSETGPQMNYKIELSKCKPISLSTLISKERNI